MFHWTPAEQKGPAPSRVLRRCRQQPHRLHRAGATRSRRLLFVRGSPSHVIVPPTDPHYTPRSGNVKGKPRAPSSTCVACRGTGADSARVGGHSWPAFPRTPAHPYVVAPGPASRPSRGLAGTCGYDYAVPGDGFRGPLSMDCAGRGGVIGSYGDRVNRDGFISDAQPHFHNLFIFVLDMLASAYYH